MKIIIVICIKYIMGEIRPLFFAKNWLLFCHGKEWMSESCKKCIPTNIEFISMYGCCKS